MDSYRAHLVMPDGSIRIRHVVRPEYLDGYCYGICFVDECYVNVRSDKPDDPDSWKILRVEIPKSKMTTY